MHNPITSHPMTPVTIKTQKNRALPLPTPIDWRRLQSLLQGYDLDATQCLINGFKFGFRLHFEGELVTGICKNLKSACQYPDIVTSKLEKELKYGRIAGPFTNLPFKHFKTSPIGLVPKKTPNEFRLIHHLSYPKSADTSVNAGIPQDYKSVSYSGVNDVILVLQNLGRGARMAKTDIESAFRILPIHPDDYHLLGFTWNGAFYYDKCLAMGAASSCRTFEIFSTALEWIARNKCKSRAVIHILDDFLFIAPAYDEAYLALSHFKEICCMVGVPLSQNKTYLPATTMEFMGITLDAESMEARLPIDKVEKIRKLLCSFQLKSSCKLKELLSLIGLLNFACCVVRPGRSFLRRLINLSVGFPDLHYQVKLSQEKDSNVVRLNNDAQLDIAVWLQFIEHFNGRCFFIHDPSIDSDFLELYTDASGSVGYGACFKTKWFYGSFPGTWHNLNISFLELYPIVVSVEIWGHLWKNHSIIFYTDNEALVSILNKKTTKVKYIMFLVRKLVLLCLRLNIDFKSRHIEGKRNSKADALSRLQVDRFRELSPHSESQPTILPSQLLPQNYCKELAIC